MLIGAGERPSASGERQVAAEATNGLLMTAKAAIDLLFGARREEIAYVRQLSLTWR
jgi:hypothetical protein